MKVIDMRSGKVMTIGKTVAYGDGEELRLIDVDEGLLSAQAFIETTYRDYGKREQRPSNGEVSSEKPPLVTSRRCVPLVVRLLHPAYLFERVAFIPKMNGDFVT